jgi:hypothetical protein
MELALFYNLKFTEVYINVEKNVTIWTLCQICWFEFICMEGEAKFLQHLKGGASYKSVGTSDINDFPAPIRTDYFLSTTQTSHGWLNLLSDRVRIDTAWIQAWNSITTLGLQQSIRHLLSLV